MNHQDKCTNSYKVHDPAEIHNAQTVLTAQQESATSCTSKTSVPTRTKFIIQEKYIMYSTYCSPGDSSIKDQQDKCTNSYKVHDPAEIHNVQYSLSGNTLSVSYHLCICHTLGTVFELYQSSENSHRYFHTIKTKNM